MYPDSEKYHVEMDNENISILVEFKWDNTIYLFLKNGYLSTIQPKQIPKQYQNC